MENACSVHAICRRETRGRNLLNAGNTWAWGNSLTGEKYITVTCGSVGCYSVSDICVRGNMDPYRDMCTGKPDPWGNTYHRDRCDSGIALWRHTFQCCKLLCVWPDTFSFGKGLPHHAYLHVHAQSQRFTPNYDDNILFLRKRGGSRVRIVPYNCHQKEAYPAGTYWKSYMHGCIHVSLLSRAAIWCRKKMGDRLQV